MKFIASVIFILGLAAGALAQSPSKVLKQAEKALGGSRALQSMRSVVRTGTITRLSDGATGKYRSQTAQPNLINVSYDIAGFETEIGYNGRSAWARNSRDGLQTSTGKASIDAQALAAYRNNLWVYIKNDTIAAAKALATRVDQL